MLQQNKSEKWQYLLFGLLLGAGAYYVYDQQLKEKASTTPPTGGGVPLPVDALALQQPKTKCGCGTGGSSYLLTAISGSLNKTRY